MTIHDPVWVVIAISFLLIIIVAQAALNLWFIVRTVDVAREHGTLVVATRDAERRAGEAASELREKLASLESALQSRHNANMALLEKIVLAQTQARNNNEGR